MPLLLISLALLFAVGIVKCCYDVVSQRDQQGKTGDDENENEDDDDADGGGDGGDGGGGDC